MSEKFPKILKYKEDENSVKILFVIYTDTESLLKSIQICDNYPGKSYTSKKKKKKTCNALLFNIHKIFIQLQIK